MPFRLARSISLCPVQKESALPRDVPGFRRVFHMKEADPVRGLLIFQLREPEPAVDLKTAQLEKDKREEIVRVLCPGKCVSPKCARRENAAGKEGRCRFASSTCMRYS